MSATHEQAVEVLNAAKLADGAGKVDHLRSLLELVVRKEPGLLPEFLPEVLELQVDPSPAVRRFLPELIDGAVAANPCPPVLAPCLACLRGLLGDGAAATARRALQSCYPAFRAAYAVVALQGAGAAGPAEVEALRALWEAASALKLAAAALVAGDGGGGASHEGVRQGAARFLEQAVLLLTAEVVPAVAGVSPAPTPLPAGNVVTGKAALVKDAEVALAQLVALLRQAAAQQGQLPPGLAATAVRSAAGIAQQRPQFMGRLLPPLLALANNEAVKEGGAAAGAAGAAAGSAHLPVGAASVAAAVKAALLALSRSTAPAAQPWKRKVAAALEALGAGGELQHRPVLEGRPDKRPLPGSDEPSKRQRLDGMQQLPALAAAPAAAAEAGARAAMLLPPLPGVQQEAAPLQPGQPEQPPATPPEQLSKVLAVVHALVASQDAAMLAGVVGSLQPAVLADVVMSYMANLPPRHALTPDSAPLEAWVVQLLQLAAEQAPPALGPAGGAAQAAVEVANGAPMPPPQQQQQQQQQQQLGGRQAAQQEPKQEVGAPLPAVKGAPALPRPSALAMASAFRLEPVPLTDGQQRALRLAAVLRILRTQKASRRGLTLRTQLVAKLAAEAEAGSQVPAIMAQLLQGIASSGGSAQGDAGDCFELEAALLWLSTLYARECRPTDEAATAAGSGASDGEADAGSGSGSGDGGSAVAAPQQRRQRQRRVPPGGSAYERTLLLLLRGLQAALPPSSKVIARALLEAPTLPQPAVCQFLDTVALGGTEWCSTALLAARDVILERPPSRQAMLAWVLDACTSPTADTRSKAVRLVANRLFPDPGMAPAIEQAARRRLDAMVPAPEQAAGQQAGPPEAAGAPASAEGVPAKAQADGSAAAGGDGSGDAAASPAAPAVAAAMKTEEAGQQEQQAPGGEHAQASPTGEGGAQAAAAVPAGPSSVEAAQLCALYCALCTKKHSLLRHLFEVHAQTSDGGRTAIQRNAGGLAKTLGAGAPALLAVVTDPPAGSLSLVLQMLHVLTETAVPPAPLVSACLQLYDTCRDARVLVPALRGLDRATALRLLPALLDLQPELLRPALQRLVAPLLTKAAVETQAAPPPLAPAVVSPEELLSALHTLDHSRDAGLLRKMMQAVTVCISSPALFPPEALAACINQLLTRVPLPQLFMRTVIQTVAAAPRLRAFVVGVLRQLAAKQIWKDTQQWKGWLLCAQQTVPDSFPAFLGLPSEVLTTAAKALPLNTKQQLLEFAEKGSMAVPSTTLMLLRQNVQPAVATA